MGDGSLNVQTGFVWRSLFLPFMQRGAGQGEVLYVHCRGGHGRTGAGGMVNEVNGTDQCDFLIANSVGWTFKRMDCLLHKTRYLNEV